MDLQGKNASQKKGRGRPATGRGQTIGVRMHNAMLERIDAWIEEQPEPRPTRPEAIRTLVASGFAADHYATLIEKSLDIIADIAREEDRTQLLAIKVIEILGGYKTRAANINALKKLNEQLTDHEK